MKVIHQSDALLVLEDRPWLAGIWLILMALAFVAGSMAFFADHKPLAGLAMLLIGGGMPLLIAALIVQRVRLTFDRNGGQITRTRRSVRGLSRTSFALERLERADVDASVDSDGTTYRMELRLRGPAEAVPFTSYRMSGQQPHRMAAAVNDWLQAR